MPSSEARKVRQKLTSRLQPYRENSLLVSQVSVNRNLNVTISAFNTAQPSGQCSHSSRTRVLLPCS